MPLDAFPDMDIPVGDSGFAVFTEGLLKMGQSRQQIGRTSESYGATPLSIFRQVSGV
jgi:hypothetical protein